MAVRGIARGVALIAAAAMAAPASALATGTIAGTITEAGTGDPLQNMCVQINVHPFGDGVSDVTDAAGQYEVADLDPGTYKAIIGPCFPGSPGSNYIQEFYDEAPSYNAATVINVVDGQTTTIDEQLEPGKTISGTVTADVGGGPLQGVCVSAHRGQFGDAVGSPVQTAADGTYTLTGFEPDTYRVRFSQLCNTLAPNVVTEFWNNKPDFASADPVVLTNAADVTGVDASLATAAAISGAVTAEAGGAPVSNFCARAQELDGDFVGPFYNTDSNGEYLIKGLATGSYKVRFTSCNNQHNLLAEYWNGRDTFASADTIAVTQGATTAGISPTLRTGGSITGRVTGSDAPGAGLAQICVYAQGVATGTFTGDETDSNGDYTVIGLPTDDYKVRFDPCHDQTYRPEHYDNQPNFTAATPVPVAAGTPTTMINAELIFDDVPPETTIVSGPAGTTASTVAGFSLSADADAVSGECRLDGGTWQTCFTSVNYTGLAERTAHVRGPGDRQRRQRRSDAGDAHVDRRSERHHLDHPGDRAAGRGGEHRSHERRPEPGPAGDDRGHQPRRRLGDDHPELGSDPARPERLRAFRDGDRHHRPARDGRQSAADRVQGRRLGHPGRDRSSDRFGGP